MVEMFEFDDIGNISVAPEVLAIRELKVLYDRSDGDMKKVWQDLSAAFFIGSVKVRNPYKGYTVDEKIELVSKDIYNKDYNYLADDIDIITAAIKIKEIEDGSSIIISFLNTMIKGVHKLQKFIEDADLDAEDKTGKLKHDAKKYGEILRDARKTVKDLKEALVDARLAEKGEEDRLKGGGIDELPLNLDE